MNSIIDKVHELSRFLNVIAGIAITFIMLLTVVDVILRSFSRPIIGAYELVTFSGALVVSFAVPLTTFLKGHIFVDFLVLNFPKRTRNSINIITRLLGVGLFFIIGWNLVKMGINLSRTGEVSMTLQLPIWPVALAIGFSAFVECLVLISQIFQVIGGTYE
jgi:TRAP-type C4-dicarboxylate transport system permease small subunit